MYGTSAGKSAASMLAMPGILDYQHSLPPRSSGKERATRHALMNSAALGLFAGSWLLGRRRRRTAATVSPAEAAKGGKKNVTTAAPTWAPADTAAIHPGVQMYTDGAQCTGNFVFTDGSGATYVGYAAHCAGTGAATDTDGCLAASLPLGTRVTFNRQGSLLSAGTPVGAGTLAKTARVSRNVAAVKVSCVSSSATAGRPPQRCRK